jgi:hypothetical protein
MVSARIPNDWQQELVGSGGIPPVSLCTEASTVLSGGGVHDRAGSSHHVSLEAPAITKKQHAVLTVHDICPI